MKNSHQYWIKIQKNIFLLAISFSFCYLNSNATSFTWTGGTTDWRTPGNWDRNSGYPGVNDTATIGSGPSVWPQLAEHDTITRLVISSGTLNLGGFNLVVTGTASCSGGTMSNGTFKPTGSTITYSGTNFTCKVYAVVGRQNLNGSTFAGDSSYFEETNSTTTTGSWNNTFSGFAKFVKNSSSGSATWSINNTTGNTFSANAVFVNNSSGNLVVSGVGTTAFNGNIQVGSTSTGDVNIGSTSGGTSTLASGKTITLDAGGFSNGTLLLRDFTQSGSTSQSFTLTSTAILNLISATFNGAVTFSSPSVLLKNSTFNGNATLTNSGSATSTSYGGNVFNGTTSITNSGTALLRLTNSANDEYYGNVTFTGNSTNPISPCYMNTSIFRANVTISTGQLTFNTSPGIAKFTGSAATQAYSATATREFSDVIIDKSAGYVTIDTTININDTLKLTNGTIVTTSSHFLVFKAGSAVTGASNSSFVSGPVKKIGNTAFVFPTGKGSDYRGVEISAPSTSTDAFTAEYFDEEQALGSSKDSTLDEISSCNYWNLARTTGSSNVYVYLYWDSINCWLYDTGYVKVTEWNGSKWIDKGHNSVTGNVLNGKVKTTSTISTFGNFTLGVNATLAINLCSAPYIISTTTTNASAVLTNSTYNPVFFPSPSAPIGLTSYGFASPTMFAIQGTFYIDQDFTFKNANVVLYNGAQISVASGKTLTIDGTHLWACKAGNMWDGVVITGGGTINVINSSTSKSVIEDAELAIQCNGNSEFHISNSQLNKNYKAIELTGSGGSTSNGSTFTGSQITCYSKYNNSTTAGDVLIAPHNSPAQRTHNAMTLYNIGGITIGNPSLAPNNFDNLVYGIGAYNVDINVYNSRFNKITRAGTTGNVYPTACIELGDNSGLTNRLLTAGGSTSASNLITNCETGIWVHNRNGCIIDGNEFTNIDNTGILTNTPAQSIGTAIDINITGNKFFSNASNAIRIQLPGKTIFFYVNNNEINNTTGTTETSKGIYIQGLSSTTLNDFEVKNNIINNCVYAITGISLKCPTSGNIYGNISGNDITFPQNLTSSGANPHFGVFMLNCINDTIANNTISYTYGTAPYSGKMTCLRLDGLTKSDVRQNEFNSLGTAALLLNSNLATQLRCNETNFANSADEGFRLGSGNATTLNQQGNNNTPNDDKWPNNNSSTRIIGSANPVDWYYRSGGIYFPNLVSATGVNIIFASSAGVTICPIPPPLFTDSLQYLRQIVMDSLGFADHIPENSWFAKDLGYRILLADTMLMHLSSDDDTTYMDFFHLMQGSNIARFADVEAYIDSNMIDEALEITNATTDTNLIEYNLKTYYDIFLNTLAVEEDMDAEDSAALGEIAYQCVIEGGPAVYYSRVLLGLYELEDECGGHDERLGQPSQAIMHRDNMAGHPYPNPTGETINLNYLLNENETGQFELYNGIGKLILTIDMEGGIHSLQVPVTTLNDGVYMYRITFNRIMQSSGKLNIIK